MEILLEVEEELSEEGRRPVVLPDPGAPSKDEVERHNITHLP